MGLPSEPLQPYLKIRPPRGFAALEVRELWQFRQLLRTFAVRDVKVRYKQTALGIVWVVLQPLIAGGIFAFVFGTVANFEAPGGVPYFLFAFTGMVAWDVFSNTLTRAGESTVSNAQLISKVYFPRLLLPLSAMLTTALDLLIVLAVVAGVIAMQWHAPSWNLLMLPVCAVLLMMLAVGIGGFSAAVAVQYRDVGHVLPVAVRLLLYASPVAYAISEVPPEYQAIFYLNPLASLIEVFRWSLLGVGQVHWGYFAYSAAFCIAALFIGAVGFKHIERSFADVI